MSCATPAPLVLDLVEAVLAVGAVAVALPDVLPLVVRVAHPRHVLPVLDRLVLVDAVQFGLARVFALAAPTALGLDADHGAVLLAMERLDGGRSPGSTPWRWPGRCGA